MSDEQTAITQLKRGEIAGLDTLVRLYQVQAVRAAYLITGSRPQSEDIVQAAFLTAFLRIGQFDAGRPFGPWFLRSVVNAALKSVTRGTSHVSLDAAERLDDWLADPHPGPDALLEQTNLHQQVAAALEDLSPAQRAAVVMRYYLGLSEDEMAQAMECAPGTVKWRLHAAREKLRVWLKPLWEGKS